MQKCYFHGVGKSYPYFEGWYLKHQNMGKTVVFIPAIHADKQGNWSASIQVITNNGAWNFTYPIGMCKIQKGRLGIKIGTNIFSEKGINVDICTHEISVRGKLLYSKLQGIEKDIMGPFRKVPCMQCNHGVISMAHELRGSLFVNGHKLEFTGGRGYIETDWGTSFPESYLWSQCGFGGSKKNSIMASVADVPFLGSSFRGCICAIHYEGKEYRLATYYGARILEYGIGKITLKQGKMKVQINRISENPFVLQAPAGGTMTRRIKESPSCRVQYRFWIGKKLMFHLLSEDASFEQAD